VLSAVEVAPVVRDAIASAQASAAGARRTIAFSPPALVVRADREMLRAALLNLLLNACQTGSENVEVSARAVGDSCHIAVADRGPGIPADVMERIFDAFYTTKKSGTGLGLAIVKRLMDMQQGTVSIRARDGGGIVAELAVPLVQRSAAPQTAGSAPS
jgi:signal transduction histidine kinase